MVFMVVALMIGAIVLLTVGPILKKTFDADAYFETRLTLSGIRNNIILASALDSGRIIFTSVGENEYKITIYDTYITAEPTYTTLETPVPPLPHYTPEIVRSDSPPPYAITATKFCILKQQDASCNPVVEVCADGDPCCTTEPYLCK